MPKMPRRDDASETKFGNSHQAVREKSEKELRKMSPRPIKKIKKSEKSSNPLSSKPS
jgi:hypothetical protein